MSSILDSQFVQTAQQQKYNTDDYIAELKTLLQSLFGRTASRFKRFDAQLPCYHPTSLTNTEFDELRQNKKDQYIITPKADGTRYFLLIKAKLTQYVLLFLKND